ncbi:DNA replication endonuclease-helicase Dna2 [Coemansia javaensis]|uniref:DNA replication ATP-dependent helicase/nuclease n=1 Tax=Coemansia javaensis TaxID=2761396 RepID=A0A9W8H4B6_9FUNG|nr:DNA replication endonuclease-helicase Dna2 [Coemansia javaensis]
MDGTPRKRRHEAVQRHHSAGLPAAKRAAESSGSSGAGDCGGGGEGVVVWMPMSPRGTLRSALRQRASSAAPAGLGGGLIVQRILDGRSMDGAQPGGEPGPASSCSPGPADPALDAAEATPLAQRRARATPRPLSMSKSERMLDKRQLLSSLLPGGLASGAPTPTAAEFADAVSRSASASPAPAPLALLRALSPETQSPEASAADDDIRRLPPPEFRLPGAADGGTDNALDLCLDDIDVDGIDVDGLMEGLDPLDGLELAEGPGLVKGLGPTANIDATANIDTTKKPDPTDKPDPADGLNLSDGLDPTDGLDELMRSLDGSASFLRPDAPSQRYRDCEKCLTLLVSRSHYTDTQQQQQAAAAGSRVQKVVRVYSQTAGRERTVLLRGEWEPTPVAIGDYLNLVGRIPDGGGDVVVIDSRDCSVLPVLNPDILVSCTHLSDSFSCLRRAVLKDRIREISDGEPSTLMLVGKLLHDLFQSCALQNRWDDKTVAAEIQALLANYLELLWECGMDETAAHQQVSEVVPMFQEWAQTYMHATPRPGAQYKVHRGGGGGGGDAGGEAAMAVSSILNIEESVWSPKFGLKGKVDMTVVARFAGRGALVVPFELKTGRNTDNAQHRAQLVLYTLLLADRYGVDIDSGLLYYPRTGEVICVPRVDDELRALVAARNAMSKHLVDACGSGGMRQLPGMLRREFVCKRCPHQAACLITHAALEAGSEQTAGLGAELWAAQVAHLQPPHLAFVRDWMRLIDDEESDMLRFRAELWNMAADYREQQTGRCIAGLRIDTASFEDTREVGSYSRYRMAFVPIDSGDSSARRRRSMLDGQIGVADPIVVSADGGQHALAVGYVVALERARITVGLDRPVRGVPKRLGGFDRCTNQVFEPVVDIQPRSGGGEETVVAGEVPPGAARDVFRVDKDEMKSTMSRVRANVMRLFVAGGAGSARCRRLVVDLDPPTFVPLHPSVEARVGAVQADKMLNAGQALVIRRVLAADDYALVMGMPGTGKTTTIAELVGVLVGLGKTVLLASYTHIAVDNILLKLADRGIPMVRLGGRNKVHPRIVPFLPSEAGLQSVQQLDEHFRRARIVATTCLGITHPIFAAREFDYCIVDEASQITLPVCLGPLLGARRFVLVGDHYQLPPLVRNAGARDGGLGTSLFKRLCEAHPQTVVRLEYQYRMSADIQRLANALIYDGHLRCGSLAVARRRIRYAADPAQAVRAWPFACPPPPAAWHMRWAEQALDPARGAVFLDTDAIPGREYRAEGVDSAQNDTEVRIVCALTALLRECGVEGRRVGVLSPYRAQLRQLEIAHGLAAPDGDEGDAAAAAPTDKVSGGYSGLEMHTIDRYQGRDADVIIISWVRSNSGRAIGDLLRDWRRINVAITRARTKLIMVGSQSTLARSPLLAGILCILRADGSVVALPRDAVIPDAVVSDAVISDAGPAPPARAAGAALLRGRPITANILADGI